MAENTHILQPQEGVDGSGGVGGFAKPPMAAPKSATEKLGAGETSSSSSSSPPLSSPPADLATTAAATAASAVAPPSSKQCLLTDKALAKFLKLCMPNTVTPTAYVMPNTQQALNKVVEHFAKLLAAISSDICTSNERTTLSQFDVFLALNELGMGQLIEPLKKSMETVHAAKKNSTGVKKKGSRKTGIQMADLIVQGLIKPGKEVLTETYKDQTFKAELREDGVIVHNGNEFDTPSSLSIYLRKIVGTHQDSSNGWQAVRYIDENGQLTKLIEFKAKAIAAGQVSIKMSASDVAAPTQEKEEEGDTGEAEDTEKGDSSSSGTKDGENDKRPAAEVSDAAPPAKRAKVVVETQHEEVSA